MQIFIQMTTSFDIEKVKLLTSSGSIVAPFSGNHGWYWLNIEEHTIEITLKVAGFYSEIKELGRSFQ